MTCGCLLVLKAAEGEHACEVVHVLRAIGRDDPPYLVNLRVVGTPQHSANVGQILESTRFEFHQYKKWQTDKGPPLVVAHFQPAHDVRRVLVQPPQLIQPS